MAIWELTTLHKKNAIEKQYWYKDGKTIIRYEGYRWGSFTCESDTKPDVDLANPVEYVLGDSDYDWELDFLDDGSWAEWEYFDGITEEEQEEIEAAWDEDHFEGLEALGWTNDDTDYIFQGPLQLKNLDTEEEFTSEEE